MKINVKKYMKIFSVFLLVMVVVVTLNSVYGAINTGYGVPDAYGAGGLDTVLKKNNIIEPISSLIYFVGLLMEKLLAMIFKMVTGNAAFPWADKIVFNAVPFLDVNFINPDPGSLLGSSTGIKEVISNTYATIFTLCTTFFAVAVTVMAIKLATTAIASDKARYKEAIWNWVVGLVLLFTIHIAISFIFYLNETVVTMASQLAVDNIALAGTNSAKVAATDMVNLWVDAAKAKNLNAEAAIMLKNQPLTIAWLNMGDSFGTLKYLTTFAHDDANDIRQSTKLLDYIPQLDLARMEADLATGSDIPSLAPYVSADLATILSAVGKTSYWSELNELVTLKNLSLGSDAGGKVLISDLATYFKYNSWTYSLEWTDAAKVKKGDAIVQNALMYAILVVQSMILFIAYTKRLFFVIILALMAPVMVVFDFFNKSIGK